MPPTRVPPAAAGASVLDTHRFGIRLEVPETALGGLEVAAPRLSIRTLAASNYAYLADGPGAAHGELPFTPVVRVDYPAWRRAAHARRAHRAPPCRLRAQLPVASVRIR